MRITLEADYAVRIVYALMENGGTISARNIAETSGITLRFALKILRKLSQGGIVDSTKGAAGGYRLDIDPDALPLGRIIECIDGPFGITHCMEDDFDCTRVEHKAICQFHHTFSEITEKIRDAFYSVKMGDYR